MASERTPASRRAGRAAQPTLPLVAESAAPAAFAEGQRARVKIRDRIRFAGNCGEQMDGKTGVVADYCARSFNGDPPLGPAFLVRFDEPVPGWHEHQLPVGAFWFPPGDLEAER